MRTFLIPHLKNKLLRVLFFCAIVSCSRHDDETPEYESGSFPYAWRVTVPHWDVAAEKQFSNWIEHFGTQKLYGKCRTVEECLKSSEVNTLWDERDTALKVFSDCADVPFLLRAYFAYKTQRPYGAATVHGGRYTPGNHTSCQPVEGGHICKAALGQELNQSRFSTINSLLNGIANKIMSGYLRTPAEDESSDTFPIDVRPGILRPGTIFYDPNGHVLTVFKIEPNGSIRLFDGHPDQTLTTKLFGEMFARGGPSQGGGFRNWRPLELRENNHFRPSNAFLAANDFGYSATAQYQPSITYPQKNYYKWVRARMAGNTTTNPVSEFSEKLKQLCVDIGDRVEAVNIAISANMHQTPHPPQIPSNIFGAEGDWETYSTPSRDARLKASMRELFHFVKETREAVANASPAVHYQGTAAALNAEFMTIWREFSSANTCSAKYRTSTNALVILNLNTIADRIYDLSFDPYHCPELRWGAKPGVDEYNDEACNVGNKLSWYTREATLRNAIDREYGLPTPIGWGPHTPEPINVRVLLENGPP
jgi:hypothetical protein